MGKAEKRIRPEDLKGRKTILVVVRYGQDGDMVKEKPARIIKVLRAAVKVHVEGEERERTVRFSELKIPPEPKSTHTKRRQTRERRGLRAVPPTFNDLAEEAELAQEPEQPSNPEQPASGPIVEHKRQPPKKEEPQPVDSSSSLDAWVAQGAQIKEQLTIELREHETYMERLMQEHTDLERRIEDTSNEIERLKNRIGLLESVQASVQDAD